MPWPITGYYCGENPGGLYSFLDTEDKIIHSYSIRPLTTEEVEHYRDRYYDGTVVYIETEDEYEPVRIMKSCFMATDLKYYELELRLSTLERDDLIAAIFKYLVALYIALLCCIIFSTRLILEVRVPPARPFIGMALKTYHPDTRHLI